MLFQSCVKSRWLAIAVAVVSIAIAQVAVASPVVLNAGFESSTRRLDSSGGVYYWPAIDDWTGVGNYGVANIAGWGMPAYRRPPIRLGRGGGVAFPGRLRV